MDPSGYTDESNTPSNEGTNLLLNGIEELNEVVAPYDSIMLNYTVTTPGAFALPSGLTFMGIRAIKGVGALNSSVSGVLRKVTGKRVWKSLPTNKDFSNISNKLSQKQNRHLLGHPQTQASYLNTIDDAKEILNAFHEGSTKIVGTTKQGFPIVNYKNVTGVNVNKGSGYLNQQTNTFIIKGTTKPSIVPTTPR